MEQVYMQLDNILRRQDIQTVFQPIVSLRDGAVFGYEALSRVPACNVEELFALAEQCNRTWELDKLCWSKAVQNYCAKSAGNNGKLFVNVDANSIYDPSFQNSFTRSNVPGGCISSDTIILEISERNAIRDASGFHSYLSHCEEQSFQIAIDDAGAGYSGLTLIADINPHFIKLDKKLVRDIDCSRIKYAIIKGMVELSEAANILLIAEGIETAEELDTLVNLGVHYGQGYIFARPASSLQAPDTQALHLLQEINRKKNHTFGKVLTNIYADNLCISEQTVAPSDRCEDVYDYFLQFPAVTGVCVVQNGKALGIVSRKKLLGLLGSRLGFRLHHHKNIEELMERDFLAVDYRTTLSTVAKLAMERAPEQLYNPVILLKEDRYLGVVSIKDLLLKTIEIETMSAKYQNPLTGLPGNLLIQHRLSCCISSDRPYSVLYLDIYSFKAYNELYGFEYGDRAIKLLADCIIRHVPCDQFVGHIGGDDFIIVCDYSDTQELCKQIRASFETEVLALYRPHDRQAGYITATNRYGATERLPLISVTIVGCSNRHAPFKSVAELTDELAHRKRKAKSNVGSAKL